VRLRAVALSALIHAVVAAGLLAMAIQRSSAHKSISVAVVTKKEEPKKPPPPPVVKAPPKVVVAKPVAEPAIVPEASAKSSTPAPFLASLDMGNDSPGGIAIPVARPPAPKAASPVKLAVAEHQRRSDLAQGEEACDEEPSKPEPIFKVEIEYPPSARAEGIEGRLVLRVFVAADGTVSKVDVVSGVDPTLDAGAVASVLRWRFKPSRRCGKPMEGGVYTLARKFELGD
jgi:protein TonB